MTRDTPRTDRLVELLTSLTCYLITISSITGCSQLVTPLEQPRIKENVDPVSPGFPRDVSIEQLESDSAFMSDQDPGLRAVALSTMWSEHGTQLERSSYSGAFAAHTRAAHIALKHLLGETCQTPFHAPCHELDRAYKSAIDALARLLAQHSWSPPDLERTRYRLTAESSRALHSLRDWQISLEQPQTAAASTRSGPSSRPGLGLATVGCRRVRESGTICSPLTFVITFSGDPASEISQMSFEAFDALQQEALSVEGRSIPLAAALEQTALTLGTLGANSSTAALFCLSAPTANTTTVLFFVQASDAVAASRGIIAPLLRDPEFINRTSLCMHTLRGNADGDVSPRILADSLRRAHSGIIGESLAKSYRQPLSVVAVGEQPTHTALAFANRVSRVKPIKVRRTSAEIRFMPDSLIIISSTSFSDGDATRYTTTELPISHYRPPCDHECLRGIKDSSRRDYSQCQVPEEQSDPALKVDAEDLPLSPVM